MQTAPGPARVAYEDRIATAFTACAVLWALLGMAVGVYVAAELVWPGLNFDQPWLSFGRLRTAHTNLVLFGFGVSALIGTSFYSVQRTSHVPLFAPRLAWFVFFGWQLVIVLGGWSLLAGWNGGKEYAELEWPFDIAITVVWLAYAVVFFGTIARRTMAPIYISNWFYGALIIVVAMLHVVNNLGLPASLGKSYSLYPGAQDAIVQWWYGHNAVGFLLTGGFLGMLYYFLPKQAEQPIWSYRLSIVAFWAFVYSYIWAGPHHLHYNAIPEWVQSLGVVMSVILLAPSWATMINGVMTVSNAWRKLKTDPALKFIVLALAFYGLATFEGPMMAIRSVNVMSHFTEWTIGHVHSGALGWNALITFGTFYYLVPKLAGRPLASTRLANAHFWLALAGVLLYIISMWGAGVSQSLLWLTLDELGEVRYSFVEIMRAMAPYYALRLLGGVLFLAGAGLMAVNLVKTFAGTRTAVAYVPAVARHGADGMSGKRSGFVGLHQALERNTGLLIFGILVVSSIGGLVQVLPTVVDDSLRTPVADLAPYPPLELIGRDVYIRESCSTCHSQQVRPLLAEVKRYGQYAGSGEFAYDRPFLWGSKRTGPDLLRVGGRYTDLWHRVHLLTPRAVVPSSIMPAYPWLAERAADDGSVRARMRALRALGHPYTDEEIETAPEAVKDKTELDALIAYMQGLGRHAALAEHAEH